MALPTLPLEIQNKIMYENKGFNPYPFNDEFKWYVDCLVDPNIWFEAINKSSEWLRSQFENTDSLYFDEWGDLSNNILVNINMKLFIDRD
jgi:hypothetical protein